MEFKKFKKGEPVLIFYNKRPYVGSYHKYEQSGNPYIHSVAFPICGDNEEALELEPILFKDSEVEHLNLKGK